MIPPKGSYKTRLCHDFSVGTCSLGSWCNYAHGDAELRQVQWFAEEEQRVFLHRSSIRPSSAGTIRVEDVITEQTALLHMATRSCNRYVDGVRTVAALQGWRVRYAWTFNVGPFLL